MIKEENTDSPLHKKKKIEETFRFYKFLSFIWKIDYKCLNLLEIQISVEW